QADLRRELGAVLPASEERHARAHRPRTRIAEVPFAVSGVAGAKPLRNQDLDRLPDQLLARIAEDPLGLAVDADDLAVGTDDDHRVGGCLQQIEPPQHHLIVEWLVRSRGRFPVFLVTRNHRYEPPPWP